MRVENKDWRAIFWQEDTVCWIDQRFLPSRFIIVHAESPESVAQAIESMQVRGAPTIGAAAAFGLALAYLRDRSRFENYWLNRFRRTRPTAVNLFHACNYMQSCAEEGGGSESMIQAAHAYADTEVKNNRVMGEKVAALLAIGKRRILTHCNAGWLAAVDWGTALSGIYHLARSGESPFVWVDETRPRLQGAKLTAWELDQENIDCKLQADSAAAWMMARGKVDAIVVGADRIASNGDVANKIGTYMLSLAAQEHGIPFYVVAPGSTFDAGCATGQSITIEERADEELVEIAAETNGTRKCLQLAPAGIIANNPAFDVTPAEKITAIISETRVWQPSSGS
ncbi:MAG: S-methyl-5-thioribose-1-phosphate isomerase [Mariprofundaceae bacterium]